MKFPLDEVSRELVLLGMSISREKIDWGEVSWEKDFLWMRNPEDGIP
jgi:hypothetical protein